MQRKLWMVLALLLLVPGLMLFTSCAQQSAVDQDTTQKTTPPADTGSTSGSDDLQAEAAKRAAEQAMNQFINEHIYFDFDSAALSAMAQATLKNKAAWLNANPGVMVTIEGHCDERGTTEYNLALGDRRAESARSFLIDLGIDPARLEKISYGEEMPAVQGSGEDVWAKNRRAAFTIK